MFLVVADLGDNFEAFTQNNDGTGEDPAAIRAAVRAGAEQAAGPDTRVEEVGGELTVEGNVLAATLPVEENG